MRKYTYSREIGTAHGQEVFTAVEFDSFDEAQKVVDKGIYDRLLELKKEKTASSEVVHTDKDVNAETDMGQDLGTSRPDRTTASGTTPDLRGSAPGPEVLNE